MRWKRILAAFLVGLAVNVTVLPRTLHLGRWSFMTATATLFAATCPMFWAFGIGWRPLRGAILFLLFAFAIQLASLVPGTGS